MREKHSNFEELLLPHLDGAYNLARWLIEKDQDAQAIVEEAYLQARQQPGKFHKADARTWLLIIVRRIAHTWIRKRDKHSKMIPFAQVFRGQSSPAKAITLASEEASAKAADPESKRSLYESMSRLPVEFREVLMLHDIEGSTYPQLAAALEIPVVMVIERLSMARKTLRKELGEAPP
jgi:RNA polymerase sigma-70 factor (ECF subfamily)